MQVREPDILNALTGAGSTGEVMGAGELGPTLVVQIGRLLDVAIDLADLAGENLLGAVISGAIDQVSCRLIELGHQLHSRQPRHCEDERADDNPGLGILMS